MPEPFISALCDLAARWPAEFLALARDPEKLGVVCRAVREAAKLPPAEGSVSRFG